jgi:hypothetical protein
VDSGVAPFRRCVEVARPVASLPRVDSPAEAERPGTSRDQAGGADDAGPDNTNDNDDDVDPNCTDIWSL